MGKAFFDQSPHHEGLKKLKGHLFGQTAFVEPQTWPNHNYRTATIVDPFPQEILAKTALFPFEHIAQALQPMFALPAHGSPAPPVVNQRIYRFLKHSLFVANDDFGRIEFNQAL